VRPSRYRGILFVRAGCTALAPASKTAAQNKTDNHFQIQNDGDWCAFIMTSTAASSAGGGGGVGSSSSSSSGSSSIKSKSSNSMMWRYTVAQLRDRMSAMELLVGVQAPRLIGGTSASSASSNSSSSSSRQSLSLDGAGGASNSSVAATAKSSTVLHRLRALQSKYKAIETNAFKQFYNKCTDVCVHRAAFAHMYSPAASSSFFFFSLSLSLVLSTFIRSIGALCAGKRR
jgi:hypothetical protein